MLERTKLASDLGGKDLGVFLPMANGGWILSSNKPTLDASYALNRDIALLADQLDFDFVLSMAKWRGYGGVTEHWDSALDAQILIAGLAEATKRVQVWTTVHTLLQNPAVTAKMLATLDQISNGRAGLNVVTGAYKDEFEQMGAWRDGVSHDARYDMASEWVSVVERLWTEPSVSFDGEYFRFKDCQSAPKPRRRPFLICAGTSPKGIDFAVQHMDAIFTMGRDNAELARNSKAAKARAKALGRTLKTYTMMTLVIAETDAAAQAEAQKYRDGLDEGALRGMLRAYGFHDSEMGEENPFVASARSSFMTSRLIGSPETIAREAVALFEETELDGLMVVFPDYLKSMPVYSSEIAPKIRARFPSMMGADHAA